VFGWLLISGVSQPDYPLADGAWFALCVSLCLLGTVIMIAADAQKYFTLRERRALITDGMYRYVRHPNYLGEMIVYGSFALMVSHWLPVVRAGLGLARRIHAQHGAEGGSLSRYPEWAAYRAKSWWLLPGIL